MTLAGFARTILTSHGKARTPAPVAEPVNHALAVTLRPLTSRRASRRVLSQMAIKGGWSRSFDDPIPLPRGRQLSTLKDAADHIMKLPRAEQNLTEWQTAISCLIGAAEGRDFLMHARIGMLRALNRNVERMFDPSRKKTHWAKRRIKRDQ
jgi:hypothetical protein